MLGVPETDDLRGTPATQAVARRPTRGSARASGPKLLDRQQLVEGVRLTAPSARKAKACHTRGKRGLPMRMPIRLIVVRHQILADGWCRLRQHETS